MDEKHLIGIYIKHVTLNEPDFQLCQPVIEGYLIDKVTGVSIKANSSACNLDSYKCPFTLNEQNTGLRSFFQSWEKLLIVDGCVTELNSGNKILIFEVCKNVLHKKTEVGNIRIAFGFLIPVASDGSMNTNKELKLQLYKVPKNCKISHQDCNIYHLYSDHKHKKLHGSLQVTVKGVVHVKPKHLKTAEAKSKQAPATATETENENHLREKENEKTWKWSRLSTQSCKVPNKIHKTFSFGKNGFSCLQFSNNGYWLAAAVVSKIIVYDILSGNEVITFNHKGFIYELNWSTDDKCLLSVSNDWQGIIWSLTQKSPLFKLPHPSYVYCGKWLGSCDKLVTGGKDNLIRYWRKSDNGFDLMEEMRGHSGFISAISTQDNSLIISGDSLGCIMVRKLVEDTEDVIRWKLLKKLSFSEISQKVIDTILIHMSRRRIIISVRSQSSYLIDIVSGIILQTYKFALNPFARSVSCLTPCGSYLFSFSQNGDVGVWEINTGKLYASYNNLFSTGRLSEFCGFIHYHPHEHMVGLVAFGQNYPLMILKYEYEQNNDSQRLGLKFYRKIDENIFSNNSLTNK